MGSVLKLIARVLLTLPSSAFRKKTKKLHRHMVCRGVGCGAVEELARVFTAPLRPVSEFPPSSANSFHIPTKRHQEGALD